MAKKTEPFFLNLNDTVKYVGIEKCRMCHEGHYTTFIQTGMGQSFGPATKQRSKADFHTIKPVYDNKLDMFYFPFWDNDKMKIMEFRLKGKDTIYKRTETISYIIGSGHHTNSHFWTDNGYIFQAPLTFYTQSQKWDLPPGFEVTNTRFNRKIDIECMSCHNAMPTLAEGAINKFTKLPAGIDCERCHGPGELHVQLKQKGELIDLSKQADRSIVNPARLPWKLQVDVCQRCHLQGNNVLKPDKKFTDFRPGMNLDSVFVVYMPKYENNNAFFMAGHAERLQMSECFKKSNPKSTEQYNPNLNFTCITCHNPHVSVRKTNIEVFNTSCKNCHSESGRSKLKKCSESPVELAKVNYNCVGCHMPSNGTADIPHVTVHDHYIRKPEKNRINIPFNQKSIGVYAVNSAKPDKDNYIQGLIAWYEKFNPEQLFLNQAKTEIEKNKTTPEIEIHYDYANSDFASIVKLAEKVSVGNTDAWTCYRIGKAFDKSAQLENSAIWYKNAVEKQKFNADFTAEYANVLIRLKRVQEAKLILENCIKEQPKHELSLINLGNAEWLLGNKSAAKKYWLRALELNPDNENTHLYLAELYYTVADEKRLLYEIEEVRRINPGNTEVRKFSQIKNN